MHGPIWDVTHQAGEDPDVVSLTFEVPVVLAPCAGGSVGHPQNPTHRQGVHSGTRTNKMLLCFRWPPDICPPCPWRTQAQVGSWDRERVSRKAAWERKGVPREPEPEHPVHRSGSGWTPRIDSCHLLITVLEH